MGCDGKGIWGRSLVTMILFCRAHQVKLKQHCALTGNGVAPPPGVCWNCLSSSGTQNLYTSMVLFCFDSLVLFCFGLFFCFVLFFGGGGKGLGGWGCLVMGFLILCFVSLFLGFCLFYSCCHVFEKKRKNNSNYEIKL